MDRVGLAGARRPVEQQALLERHVQPLEPVPLVDELHHIALQQAQGPEMFPQNGSDGGGGGGRLFALLQWHGFRIGGPVTVVARKAAVP